MLFNKVSGGSEKVTIDGKPARDKINLKEETLLKNLPTIYFDYSGIFKMPEAAFYKKIGKYVAYSNKNAFFILDNPVVEDNKRDNYTTVKNIEALMRLFSREDDLFLLNNSGTSIYKLNETLNERTHITSIPSNFVTSVIYDADKDELYAIKDKIYKYNFKEDSWTLVSNGRSELSSYRGTVKDSNLYWFGYTKIENGILKFDGKNFTEISNALPNKLNSYANNGKAIVLNDKIHYLGGYTTNDNTPITSGHFVEGNNISEFKKLSDLQIGIDSSGVAERNDRCAIFNLNGSVEMISSYIKEV